MVKKKSRTSLSLLFVFSQTCLSQSRDDEKQKRRRTIRMNG